jgi:hypothetical protein
LFKGTKNTPKITKILGKIPNDMMFLKSFVSERENPRLFYYVVAKKGVMMFF